MKFKKLSELGRSMVEMLGVLAVIGVLTVGGLAGYNYAITKHRVNTILNEINLRWVAASQQITMGIPLDMSEFDDTILGNYTIDVYQPEDNKSWIAFELSNLPRDVMLKLFDPGSELYKLPFRGFEVNANGHTTAQSGYKYPQPIPVAYAEPTKGCILLTLLLADDSIFGMPDDASCGGFSMKSVDKQARRMLESMLNSCQEAGRCE